MGVSAGTPVLFGAMFTAFMSHYNSPKYFAQLREHNPERFNRAVGLRGREQHTIARHWTFVTHPHVTVRNEFWLPLPFLHPE
eukprot:366124-Amphidinium_carterae.1